MPSTRSLLSFALTFPILALAGNYSISDTYQGDDFLTQFDYFTDDDPTHGYVCVYPVVHTLGTKLIVVHRNYVDLDTAKNNQLVQVSGTNFTMRADDQAVPNSSARGRDSVRITSQKTYSTHVAV